MTLDLAVRERVVTLLPEGRSRNEIATLVGCSAGSVTNIAAAEGHDFVQSAKSEEARASAYARRQVAREFAAADRLALLNRGLVVAERLLVKVKTGRDLQVWAGAVGTLIDKHRLEAGEATERTEVTTDAARDRLARRLMELAAAGDQDGAAGGVL
jgi:hypothetical protein